MSPFSIVDRWRDSKGYGVHFPLAYRIVKECIKPDSAYGYYSDDIIDHTLHDHPRARWQARLLVRLAAQLPSDRILALGADPLLAEVAALLPDTGAENPTVVVDFRKSGADVPAAPSLVLTGRSYTIYIWREGMLPISYTLL